MWSLVAFSYTSVLAQSIPLLGQRGTIARADGAPPSLSLSRIGREGRDGGDFARPCAFATQPAKDVPARTGDVRAGLSDRCRVDGGRSIDRISATFLFGLSRSGILVSTDIGVAG